jgi:hypothetical protein
MLIRSDQRITGKLKEVFLCNAEDVLDEFECGALRRQVVKTAGR